MKTLPSRRGFTLVEVLIALSIIILLASVVFVSSSQARAKARDVERLNNVSQLSIALRLYAEQYGEYPNASSDTSYPNCSNNDSFSSTGCLQVLVDRGFIAELPEGNYQYNNWCRNPGVATGDPGVQPTKYRLYVASEQDQQSSEANGGKWWSDFWIGATSCVDPS